MRRLSFSVRLLVTAAATLLVLLAVALPLGSSAVRSAFLAEQAQDYAADAEGVAAGAREADDSEEPLDEAQELVSSIARRPSVELVQLVDDRGRVVAASNEKLVGSIDRGLAGWVREGRARRAEIAWETGSGSRLQFVQPLRLAGRSYGLVAVQSTAPLEERLDDLQSYMAAFAVAALPVGMLVFHLLGGSHLAGLHRRTVERALHDGLTGLGNHSCFHDAIARELAFADRHGDPLTLAVIDIDDFKCCNDRLGHQYGDRVLRGIAAALRAGRESDACFRIGGDEFAMLLPRTGIDDARIALQSAVGRAQDELPGVNVSVGLAVSCSATGSRELLWEQADAAVYEAKRVGGTAIVAFDDISTTTALTHPEKVRGLRALIEEGELDVAFQPIWDLDRNAVLGYEALARPAERYGFDGPGEAFELAERTGRAHLLCRVARERALESAHRLPPGALLFLNVSPKSLEHDMLAGDSLVQAVRRAGLEPGQVVLELTEYATTRLRQVTREIARLGELGFRIALDDVGGGNAGLELLCSVDADYVKIDRSVVTSAVHDRSAHGVLEAVIAYARRTGAFVIAEGIEYPAQLDFARHPFSPEDVSFGVRGGQGYLLGRPAYEISEPPVARYPRATLGGGAPAEADTALRTAPRA